MMTQQEKWRELLLKTILVVGAITLTIFPIVYAIQGQWFYAIIEGVSGMIMWISLLIVTTKHLYKWPARIGWVGVVLVITVLLFTGGIAGTGLLWWSLLPIASYVLFGSKGGTKAVFLGFLIFLLIVLLGQLNLFTLYFSMIEVVMALTTVVVISLIMYNYEKISSNARDEAEKRAVQIEEQIILKKDIENKLVENLNRLESEKNKQLDIRTAMLNLLEDAKDLEKQLQQEKEGVEKKVESRTFELSESNARLQSAIDSVPRIFVVFDKDNKIILHNNRINDIFQSKETEWTTEKISKILGEKIELIDKLNEVLKTGKLIHVRDFDFGSRILSVYIGPVIPKGETTPIGSVLTVEDITEKAILERSKDEFFSIASHELRTPLTAIRGNTSMILDYYAEAVKDPELKAMVDDIHDSSIRLINIVNDFLNVSRLEQNRMVYDLKETSLDELIPEIIKEFDVTGSRKKLSIEHIKSPTPLPFVISDPDKVRQVLINLLGNALKFTEIGGVKISTEIVDKFVKVLVTDTGRGISQKQQALLFHKFQQAGASLFTRDTAGGSGLGLYISRMMVEGMGGEVNLESSVEGKGSVFFFSLPIATKTNKVNRLTKIGLAENAKVDKTKP